MEQQDASLGVCGRRRISETRDRDTVDESCSLRIPEEPWEEFLIAIAGPLVTVVITAALVLFAGAHLQPSAAAAVDNLKIPLVDRLAAVNLFLALFNLIPAFPMDGGRVLRALLASRLGYVRATEIAAAIGQFVAFALGFIGLMYNPILIFIAIFVYLAASSEAHMVALRAASRGVPVSHAMVTHFETLAPEAHLDGAVQTLLQTGQGEFPVVDAAGKPVGVLGRGDLIRAIKTLGPDARVADAMTPELPTIGHRLCLEDAFKLLMQKAVPAVGVTDASGKLVGLVTSETIAEMMMLQDILPNGVRAGPWGRPAGA
jgi:CBS domain-containing protein